MNGIWRGPPKHDPPPPPPSPPRKGIEVTVRKSRLNELIDEQYPGLRTSNRRGNHTPGEMNKTEQRFFRDHVEPLLFTGEIVSCQFESIKFKIAGNVCWYTIDFFLLYADGHIEAIDVKGGKGFEDDALVKIKVAAAQYPMFHWSSWTWTKKTGWVQRKFGE